MSTKRVRRKAASYLRKIAERLSPTLRPVPHVVPEPQTARQAKALEDLVNEQRKANRIARRVESRDEFERDRMVLHMDSDTTGTPMQEGVKIRVESDGTGMGTRVMVGDQLVSNAVRVTWTASADGVARAVIECDAVMAQLDGTTS